MSLVRDQLHHPVIALDALERLARSLRPPVAVPRFPCECALRGWACHCEAEYRRRLVRALDAALLREERADARERRNLARP